MSGLPTDKFSFFGFMPKKKSEQKVLFENLRNDTKTLIFFDSPKRIQKTISNLIEFIGVDRRIAICREMTKLHEEIIRGSLKDVIDNIKTNKILLRGEIVLVIEGSKKNQTDYFINSKIKNEYLNKLSASDAAKLISLITGQNKRNIYKYLIED